MVKWYPHFRGVPMKAHRLKGFGNSIKLLSLPPSKLLDFHFHPIFPFLAPGMNNRSRPTKPDTRPRSSVEVTFHPHPCSRVRGQVGRDPPWWLDQSHDTAGERRTQICQGGTCEWYNNISSRGRERERERVTVRERERERRKEGSG